AGDPIRLVLLEPGGVYGQLLLGPDPAQGHVPQFTVPAGVWQASATIDGGRWSLYGCTCAPPFTPAAYEGGTLEPLLAGWPERDADIRRFAAPFDAVRMPG
ncbi:MAG: cupin domain-containing protein, partial [Armatimonadota bacterium]